MKSASQGNAALQSGGSSLHDLPIAAASLDVEKKKAGTGMGEEESNPTQMEEFNFDTGMYRLSQALVIYYDFAEAPAPNPFPALSYAPEMP